MSLLLVLQLLAWALFSHTEASLNLLPSGQLTGTLCQCPSVCLLFIHPRLCFRMFRYSLADNLCLTAVGMLAGKAGRSGSQKTEFGQTSGLEEKQNPGYHISCCEISTMGSLH